MVKIKTVKKEVATSEIERKEKTQKAVTKTLRSEFIAHSQNSEAVGKPSDAKEERRLSRQNGRRSKGNHRSTVLRFND